MNLHDWTRRRQRRRDWEALWREADFDPAWRVEEPPAPLREAVAEGWFAGGMRVLDLGCGSGDLSAWLADHGCRVLGVDFAAAAIDRARATHPVRSGLAFRRADATGRPRLGRFDAILDRGCLQGLEPGIHAAYARNLRRWSRPGAHVLLLMRHRGATLEGRVRELRDLLGPTFELLDARDTDMQGPSAKERIPGGAYRLRRI